MPENIDLSDFIIEDIDLPLYKYGLIHREDINSYLNCNKGLKWPLFVCYTYIIWLIFGIFRHTIYLKEFKNEEIQLFSNDFLKYVGGITEFYYIICAIASAMTLRVVLVFKYSDIRLYRWLDIIKVLKGLQTMDTIGIFDENEMRRFVKRVKYLRFLKKITIICASASIQILCAFILISYFDSFTSI